MPNLKGRVAKLEETVEPGKPVVRLWYIVSGDPAEDFERKYAALQEYREVSGHDIEPEGVSWIEIEIVEGRKT